LLFLLAAFLIEGASKESPMINIEITKSKIIATVGASIFACALAVPAFALPTKPVSNPSDAGIVITHGKYDHTAPLAGQQFAEEGDEVQPYDGEDNEHLRHEEMEHEGREELHHMREKGEEHAERLRSRAEEERAEHERHEIEEHHPYEHSEDAD
jgi:hypothetical protein